MKSILRFLLRTLLFLFVVVNIITAFHAYKFTHFYDPDQVKVKRNEDKSGWDKTSDILFGAKAVKQKNRVADSAWQTVQLTTAKGLKLEGWYISRDSAKGTVILFHGHGGSRSGVVNEALRFHDMGYNTLLMDFRAHGNSQGNTCTIGYEESEDVKLAFDHIRGKGEKHIILWGISMGAAAVTKAIHDYDLAADKVILEMPFGSILQAAEGRLSIMKLPREPLASLVTFWGGVEQGFWAFSMKPSRYARSIHCPTLVQWGRNDPRVSWEETAAVYNNIPAQKKLVIYENSVHKSLYDQEPEKWIKEVSNFLQ